MSENRFYTCTICGEIKNEKYDLHYLDGAKVCWKCLDEKLYGDKRRCCAKRGYHLTRTSRGEFIGGEKDGVMPFESRPTCECGASTRFLIDVRATPTLNSDGSQSVIFGIPMSGYRMPDAPKRWFLLEGKPTTLPDDEFVAASTSEGGAR